ncbi:MAG: hypothetical protein FWF52_02790 [Candidatus Azobacteroides sp.]|nr:hypothetical protein [Candidatus Azobacteroides sp.]
MVGLSSLAVFVLFQLCLLVQPFLRADVRKANPIVIIIRDRRKIQGIP